MKEDWIRMLASSISFRYWETLALDARVEGGYTVLPVASAEPGATIRGVWMAAQVGFGVAF